MTTQRTPEETSLEGWNARILDQLDFHWRVALRPRLDGLTDHEYRWEPVPDCWNVRPRGETGPSYDGAVSAGAGDYVIDFAFPEPTPPPVTTIAWRLGHLIVGVLGARNASHFGGPETDYPTHDYSGTADGALEQLDAAYERWTTGVRGLGEDGLARPCGPAEGPYAESPLADLVLHINREVIHHGAEIALLRDLYAHRTA
ncbi:serine/arginine repetitive matrix protein 1 [Kocuria polaris]|nr:serine/arginine repetitive matrix protein 1 [Kocuria polaris]